MNVYDEQQWWGYVHKNGTLQVKRYFGPKDLKEAEESPFVKHVLPVILAENREHAIRKLSKEKEVENPSNITRVK